MAERQRNSDFLPYRGPDNGGPAICESFDVSMRLYNPLGFPGRASGEKDVGRFIETVDRDLVRSRVVTVE